jgi:plasmid rolling circle replication initiator protein Rep
VSCKDCEYNSHLQTSRYIQKKFQNLSSNNLQSIFYAKMQCPLLKPTWGIHIGCYATQYLKHFKTLEKCQSTQLKKILDVVNQNIIWRVSLIWAKSIYPIKERLYCFQLRKIILYIERKTSKTLKISNVRKRPNLDHQKIYVCVDHKLRKTFINTMNEEYSIIWWVKAHYSVTISTD